jgi:hypothetical protein
VAKGLSIIGIVVVTIFVIGFYGSFIHNYHVFPLGRLAKELELDMSCDIARSEMNNYVNSRSDIEGIQFSVTAVEERAEWQHLENAKEVIAIYDPSSIFDDTQLSIVCSTTNTIIENIYIGD